MKVLLKPVSALVVALSIVGITSVFADDDEKPLTKVCTQQLQSAEKAPLKLVLVVTEDGSTTYYAPYGRTLVEAKFPFKVTDIAEPPDVFTLIQYHASPLKALFCYIDAGGGKHCY